MASTRLTDMGAWMRQVDERLRNTEFANMQKKPRATISREAAVSQPTAQTSITWDTEQYQTPLELPIWDPGNPTIIVLRVPGWWEINSRIVWATNNVGLRQMFIVQTTGSTIWDQAQTVAESSSSTWLRVQRRVYSDGTFAFAIQTAHSSTTNPLGLGVGHRQCRVEVEYLGP